MANCGKSGIHKYMYMLMPEYMSQLASQATRHPMVLAAAAVDRGGHLERMRGAVAMWMIIRFSKWWMYSCDRMLTSYLHSNGRIIQVGGFDKILVDDNLKSCLFLSGSYKVAPFPVLSWFRFATEHALVIYLPFDWLLLAVINQVHQLVAWSVVPARDPQRATNH